ncbi:uncharacterized protein PV07_04123 [Cladophialophora immunda]|uniref:Uncharacterized protein n=1 Tax=Cladophialophora immunda TaxID=569365 RepID=A0A0D2CMY8_9EURO|nr:uncharacterized protein PV07_04123 [Cladophialophora immunda]KIW32593.1 hypothetical protein PV07_04123 [Cladophialophora immunda]
MRPLLKLKFVRTTVKAKGAEINISGVSSDHKTMVAFYSNARADATAVDEGRLTWSELVFQRYSELAGPDVNKLESVVRCSVSNPGTINTLKKAFQDMGKPYETDGEKIIFHANAPAGSAEQQAFDAILRTDNVRGVNWMLADHHNAFGKKQIISVTVWPDEALDTFMLISIG